MGKDNIKDLVPLEKTRIKMEKGFNLSEKIMELTPFGKQISVENIKEFIRRLRKCLNPMKLKGTNEIIDKLVGEELSKK